MKVAPREADRFAASPPAGIGLFLVHGSDAGAVSERAEKLAQAARARDPAGGSPVSLTSDMLAADPARLADEVYATALFGGDPVIRLRVTDNRHNVMAALKPLLEQPPDKAAVIVEAGDLPATSALRKAFEEAPRAASLACYAGEAKDVAALAREVAAEFGLAILPDALDQLAAQLGADRRATRGELEKLMLYVGADGPVTGAHVAAIVGESVDARGDSLLDAALLGESDAVDADLERLIADGTAAPALLIQALRQAMALQALRTEVDAGKPVTAAVERARPPIFFKRKPAVEAILRAWPEARLGEARRRLGDALLVSRRHPDLATEALSEALLKLAAIGARLRGTGRRG